MLLIHMHGIDTKPLNTLLNNTFTANLAGKSGKFLNPKIVQYSADFTGCREISQICFTWNQLNYRSDPPLLKGFNIYI